MMDVPGSVAHPDSIKTTAAANMENVALIIVKLPVGHQVKAVLLKNELYLAVHMRIRMSAYPLHGSIRVSVLSRLM
jgi:hypothetical protein